MATPHPAHLPFTDGTPLAVTFAPDRFKLLRCLGQGGMGSIQLAMDHQLGRFVALKFPNTDREDQEVRTLLEARYQASIQHPNVVPVYEVGFLQGRPCIAMAYIEGPNLWEARGALSLPVRVELVAQAARGVHAAHRAGLIHRDLKPENILVADKEGGGWRAYVTDFGLAKQEDLEDASEGTGLAGTLAYMPPEQLAGDPVLDPRSDVYSLGAVLYAMVTDHPPAARKAGADVAGTVGSEPRLLSREAPEAAEVFRLIHEAPPKPRALVKTLAPDLETIVLHAMEKEAHRRYASARDLAEDLDRFLAGEPIRARRPTRLYRLARFAAKNRALTGLSIAVVLGLLGVAASFLYLAHRAQTRAFLAQQFAMQAQQIEQHLRLAHMLPPHDRTPELQWAMARMAEMRTAAAREGVIAQGPFGYLAGATDLLMDRPQAAQAELERAWNLGYRTPMVAQALGEAVMENRLARTVVPESNSGLGPEGTKALAYLKQARLAGTFTPLLEARIAQIEGREEEAIGFCEQALKQTPWAYEAHLQIGQVWLNRAYRADHFQAFQAILDQALGQFDQAITMAPSDPKPLLLKAYAIRQLERRRVEFGPGLDQTSLLAAIALCNRAEGLDPFCARVFGERSLLRCVLILHGDRTAPKGSLEANEAAMLADGRRSQELDPSLDITQAALGWALQTKGEVAFQHRTPERTQEVERSEQALRDLLANHPLATPLHKAFAYALWNRMDLLQEAGLDPRPAARELIKHLKISLELQSQRLWFLGEQVPDWCELGERLTYLGELEHAWGDSPAAQAALQEGLAALDKVQDKERMVSSLPHFKGWNLLLQAQLLAEAGQDPGSRIREAEAALQGAPREGLFRSYNRISRCLPYHRHLLEAQILLRRGGDPRPEWSACIRQARKEALVPNHSGYPLYGLVLAAIQEVRYCLGRGLDATGPGKACLEGARRLAGLDTRRWSMEPHTGLEDLGKAYGHLALQGPAADGTQGWRQIRTLRTLEARHLVLAGGLFQDPRWVEWLNAHDPRPNP